MKNFKIFFVLSTLLFIFLLSVNSFSKEGSIDTITITDAKQLKGLWEALYIYQETPRQERINTYIPPMPNSEEFESKYAHQEQVNKIKKIYERRVEESLKKEIANEQRFKNMVFKLKLSYNDMDSASYKNEETMKVDRKTLSTKYFKIPGAWFQEFQNIMLLFETRFIHNALSLPIPSTVPPFVTEWRIEEYDLLMQEDIACLNFSLDKYDMEGKRFPIIFPSSQFPQGENEWVYYTNKLYDLEPYTEIFKKSDADKIEQWLIKFDELPTYVSFPIDKAKTVRKNKDGLILELEFQPIHVEKKINSNTTYYTLEVKLLSAVLKNSNKVIYVAYGNIQ